MRMTTASKLAFVVSSNGPVYAARSDKVLGVYNRLDQDNFFSNIRNRLEVAKEYAIQNVHSDDFLRIRHATKDYIKFGDGYLLKILKNTVIYDLGNNVYSIGEKSPFGDIVEFRTFIIRRDPETEMLNDIIRDKDRISRKDFRRLIKPGSAIVKYTFKDGGYTNSLMNGADDLRDMLSRLDSPDYLRMEVGNILRNDAVQIEYQFGNDGLIHQYFWYEINDRCRIYKMAESIYVIVNIFIGKHLLLIRGNE